MRRSSLFPIRCESLESRLLFAAVAVDASQIVRAATDQVLGVNLSWRKANLNLTPQTLSLVQDIGTSIIRFPGGGSSNEFHFNDSTAGGLTFVPTAQFIESLGATGLVTLNYGGGSPQEAAAMMAYLNGSTNNATILGVGEQWDSTNNQWVNKDWKTAGYWASLRAASPLQADDGLNFLRINRAQPFAVKFVEIGNEVYSSSSIDHHTAAHDQQTYIAFAKEFSDLMATIDPTIGMGLGHGKGATYDAWAATMYDQCVAQGFTPDFISDHCYAQSQGQENDATLLTTFSWANRAAALRAVLQQKFGAAAKNIDLKLTEFNSVNTKPGKQTTSIVNGLYVADTIGSLIQSEYSAAIFWNLRNSYETANNNSASLYGWRQAGDYGLLGSGSNNAPATGTFVKYPTYFAEQLLSKMIHDGDDVIKVASNDANLSAYGVRQSNGKLDLLVVNKNSSSAMTGNFTINGFQPLATTNVWQYGKTEDTAQSQTADGSASLTTTSPMLNLNGAAFDFNFPAYSMTLLELSPAGSISGNVFNDVNANGAKDAGDNGISAWKIYLDANNNGNLDAGEISTTTNASGDYVFSNLPAGSYHVKQQLANGFRKTVPTGVPGYDVSLNGSSATGTNFGNTTNILLAGTVYNDANNNNTFDPGESPMPGVTINIVSNSTVITTRTTDANGKWRVQGLSAGTGEAIAALPAGYTPTFPANAKYAGSMTSGQADQNLNFGLHLLTPAPSPASLSIFTYHDSSEEADDGWKIVASEIVS